MSIPHVDCILLDLDGLLVDTEGFHYRAYVAMCQTFGYRLPWTFQQYFHIASSSSSKIQEQLRILFPELFEQHCWTELYTLKQNILYSLLETEPIPLMPHVQEGFTLMVQTGLPIAVVTHSTTRCIEAIRSAHPLFSPVAFWIGREDYRDPKPAPDAYLSALRRLQVSANNALGFEDSLRGVQALKAAGCKAVLINATDIQARETCKQLKIDAYPSFSCIPAVLLTLKKRGKLCG